MSDAPHNLGKIILVLLDADVFVRLNSEKSVFGGTVYVIQATFIKNNQSYNIKQMVTTAELEQISDPHVIADLMLQKLQEQYKARK